eukprot:COSAG06_NODE_9695_length_1842_cov_1.570855_2_plen_205_part_00
MSPTTVAIMLALLAGLSAAAPGSSSFLPAGDALVRWSGRTTPGAAPGSVRFDWLGVSARVSVRDASWVTVVATTTAPTTGTRLRAYTSDQGFGLYPLVSFYVSPHAANETLLFAVDNATAEPRRTLTLENMLESPDATTIHGFRTATLNSSAIRLRPRRTSCGRPARRHAAGILSSRTGRRATRRCSATGLARRAPRLLSVESA